MICIQLPWAFFGLFLLFQSLSGVGGRVHLFSFLLCYYFAVG